MSQILLSGVIVLFSFTLEVITGFGGTVTAVSFITALLGMHTGVVILTVIAMIPQLSVVIRNRKKIDWKNYLIIVGLMFPFLFAGRALQSLVDTAILKRILACFIIAVSVFRLVQFFMSRKEQPARVKWYSYLALAGAGVIHGMFSSGGPLAIIYASSAIRDKDSFRSTMCLLWVTLNTVLTVSYAIDGSITVDILKTILYLIPFVIAGIIAGNLIVKRVDNKVFAVIVYSCLLVTGIFMLI
ncbi:MAG: sulfite exporter TauE/SafE family protein [Spirochaetales bacterium]|nr:sulfite exporter TauE/SafE family protein [Spirochaetales bacterium]